ncbi:MAG TPA: AAA family ATPase [Abditibacteriaceae bacterium]|jgi:SpoVK/Ycf46/Vps4 family AAA+-type ATPase
MANPLRDFFMGTVRPKADLIDAVTPRKTFNDVIVPPSTRRALDQALVQMKKHDLMFHTWGLAERHGAGLGLAFNFAGPPGTGKTICAEAIAHSLGKKLLVVRYSEMESLWAGETGKNVSAVFRSAADQDAVLFFDEADAIAGRRFSSVTQGYQREANTVVNVLLKELEDFAGVVIFATNMAANFDPAFERRIRTHVLFEMPDVESRARIWQVQLSKRTPLADDVDFDALANEFEVAGGDIKNAVLKAAQLALMEEGADAEKTIHQRHFEQGMNDVLASKKVMEQTLEGGDGSNALAQMAGLNGAWSELSRSHGELEETVEELAARLGETESSALILPSLIEQMAAAQRDELQKLQPRLASLESTQAEANARLQMLPDAIKNEFRSELHSTIETAREAERAARQEETQRIHTEILERFGRFQIIAIATTCLLAVIVAYAVMK